MQTLFVESPLLFISSAFLVALLIGSFLNGGRSDRPKARIPIENDVLYRLVIRDAHSLQV